MKYQDLLFAIKEGKVSITFPPQYGMYPAEIRNEKDFKLLQEKLRSFAGGYLVIDVWNLRASLSLRLIDEGGTEIAEPVEDLPEELEELLEEAVYDAGGALNFSGVYRLNEKCKRFLIKEAEKKTA